MLNIDTIKQELSKLEKNPFGHFIYQVGSFTIQIFTHERDFDNNPNDCITNYVAVSINLSELHRFKGSFPNYGWVIINLEKDDRFKNYQPIKYGAYPGLSNGRNMPVIVLCELIKYLHRLSDLAAFT